MEVLNRDRQVKLKIEKISRFYEGNSDRPALDDISFEVFAGEFLSVLGPSGCGKTTLLRVIVGLLPPSGGRIYLDGRDITDAPPSERSMGIVFQNYALFANMTVLKNVTYAAGLKAKREKSDGNAVEKEARELLELLGIAGLADKYPKSLSGGQQQRVAIARTMILRPEVILFDEPMSALDMEVRLQLRRLLKDIQRRFGTTMLYVTHDQEEAFALSDRIMVMRDAHLCQLGVPEEIVARPADAYVQSFVVDNLQMKLASLKRFAGKDGSI